MHKLGLSIALIIKNSYATTHVAAANTTAQSYNIIIAMGVGDALRINIQAMIGTSHILYCC